MTVHGARIHRRSFLALAGAGAAGLAAPALSAAGASADQGRVFLHSDRLRVHWARDAGGWTTESIHVRADQGWRQAFAPAGGYGVLMHGDDAAPDREAVRRAQAGRYLQLRARDAVADGDTVRFGCEHPSGTLSADWSLDPEFGQDLLVTVTWTPRRAGWYSLPSPTLATVGEDDLAWGVVPGYWSSSTAATDAELSRRYNLGVPAVPLLAEERSTTSLVAAVQSAADGATLAVAADSALARDPWPTDRSEHTAWQVGTSLRDLGGALTPTLFSPVLGQRGSWLEAGQPVSAAFRYVLVAGGWADVTDHVTRDVYQLPRRQELARNVDSLSHRIHRMHDFLVTPESQWHTWTYEGLTLGAESGKLSDVGAMWMMTRLTDDPVFRHERLPYARNFKLAQQQTADGPFRGAALGEYFRDGQWISEIVWANLVGSLGPDYVSPIFTTFYTLADDGNIALFDPDDAEIRERLRLGAERLLEWQHDDGSFDIGYLRDQPDQVKYPELPDLRATWYGFVAAYRVLGDQRYLDAAKRGADWFIEHAVATGDFLGVCDDARLIRDFQVIFAAQALLDLYEVTEDERYRDAAVEAATFYTLHIFDHPIATDEPKTFNGGPVEDWQLGQSGLPFEHAGFHGSVNGVGPITLASHAGAFVRFHELTGRQLFLDLARAAARGRDEWVGEQSGIPSYYWSAGNGGSSVFPWHGWWHMGWLMDYVLAESHLRSGGEIAFPHGFCTAKVGSHRPYGFAAGTIFGHDVQLWMPRPLVTVDDPEVDWLTARSVDGGRLFVVAVNESPEPTTATVRLDPRSLVAGQRATWGDTQVLAGDAAAGPEDGAWTVELPGLGVAVFAVDATLDADPEGPRLRGFDLTGSETELRVSWAYWASVTTWAQWRVGGGDWTDTPRQEGYSLTATIDLRDVTAPATVEVRVAAEQPNGVGYSEPLRWPVPRLGQNIALGRPVEVSSTYAPQYVGANLVDGDRTSTASRWLSAVDDEQPTATFTLAETTTPKLLRLYTGTLDRQVVVAWTVQARTATGWVDVGAVADNTSLRRDVWLDPVATDHVRLVVTERSRDSIDVARIFEIEIYDDAEVAP
ncbi:discoidin domain-containing protein [Jiangella asiatica]|uniref:Glycerophosphoryl diester phosphodiesterase n=1 Tax=Jiangella asiatica TaxID=2530372 RepID=A0A4R5DLE9_9ACTN|nr:discoidin domain-containing protein [Jiangella asiatica]TDE15056.1 glycerophosphoryl diester phosphodiesterase [Jiangella asiatica]